MGDNEPRTRASRQLAPSSVMHNSPHLGRATMELVMRMKGALPQRTSAFSTISLRLDATPGGSLQPVHISLFPLVRPWYRVLVGICEADVI